jgi:electron transport complex protein RnfD
MGYTILATIPAIIAQIYWFGFGVLHNIIIATITALICEALVLKLRNKPIKLFLCDLSIILSAILLAMCLPANISANMTILGSAIMVIIGKQIYGGLGHNIFNPAMVGYVCLLICYPMQMTDWSNLNIYSDALTGATPLNQWQTARIQNNTLPVLTSMNNFSAFAWINFCWLLGGVILLARRIISWHIPLSVISSMGVISCIMWLSNPFYPNPLLVCFSGATMLGAFFIATDPVTSPASIFGKICFGIGVGIITIAIRLYGGYPDGMAFAVLLMNMCVPLYDKYLVPRVFGN